MNPVNGVVGVFNIQGSSWSRKKRQFHIHNPDPPTLQTLVRPSDVHPFAQDGTSANDCAVYSDKTGSLVLATQDKDVCVKVASGECDVVTVAPVHSVAMGFQIACIGLVNMLNAGGAVLDVKLGSTRNGSAQCEVLVKGFGQLLFYATAAPNQVTSNSKSLKFEYEGKRLMIDMPNAPGLQNVVLVQF